jgi:hypothetical protein
MDDVFPTFHGDTPDGERLSQVFYPIVQDWGQMCRFQGKTRGDFKAFTTKCCPLRIAKRRMAMARKTKTRKPRVRRSPTETQLIALRQSTTARKQATVERLRTAITSLKDQKKEISVQTIYDECGLCYAAIHRYPEALALFRANSTHLVAAKKQNKRKPPADEEATPTPRDPLLSYKKPQLVARLRSAQQQLQETQQQQAVLVEARLKQEARIAELEAKLAVLEPYRAFVEQMRAQMRREEQGRFGDFPPDA